MVRPTRMKMPRTDAAVEYKLIPQVFQAKDLIRQG